jgi:kumamolisin
MNRWLSLSFSALTLAAASLTFGDGYRYYKNNPDILIPDTSIGAPGEEGILSHTNHLLFVGRPSKLIDPSGDIYALSGPSPLLATPSGYGPAQIRAAYGVTGSGSGVICIVDAYHYNTSLNDFNVFSAQYGLPQETSTNATASTNQHFQVVYQGGTKPRSNGGWAQEEALDIEWAHAMAPNAKIVLVEAQSNSNANLYAAEDLAASIAGCKEVSNSWGGGESSGESSNDSHFVHSGVVFFASSGDTGGVREYPAASPNVVACGGTSLKVDASGNRLSETVWSGAGCGPSAYEPRPAFQSVVSSFVGSARGIADISAVADPNTGVAVYDSTSYQGLSGWLVFGGTSVACPVLAGSANSAGHNSTSSDAEHTLIYGALGSSAFHDITSGTAGSFGARVGYDYPTGCGTPNGAGGI